MQLALLAALALTMAPGLACPVVEGDDIDVGACEAVAALRAALASRSPEQLRQATCLLAGFSHIGWSELEPAAPVPQSALFALARGTDPVAAVCAQTVLASAYDPAADAGDMVLGGLGDTLRASLALDEPARVDTAITQLHALHLTLTADERDQRGAARSETVLLPALGRMTDLLVGGRTNRGVELSVLILSLGPKARAVMPTLLRGAAADGSGQTIALLAKLAPDDPAFEALLERRMAQPQPPEAVVMSYWRLLGKRDPDKTIALLTAAARGGSIAAIEALGEFGVAARASSQVLIEQMLQGRGQELRGAAFSALLDVSDGDPAALTAIAQAIIAPEHLSLPARRLGELYQLKAKAAVLLPALETWFDKPSMDGQLKQDLARIIGAMGLPPQQTRKLLARLARVNPT